MKHLLPLLACLTAGGLFTYALSLLLPLGSPQLLVWPLIALCLSLASNVPHNWEESFLRGILDLAWIRLLQRNVGYTGLLGTLVLTLEQLTKQETLSQLTDGLQTSLLPLLISLLLQGCICQPLINLLESRSQEQP